MPRGDGSGPAGMGPMTGRAAGFCAGYNTPGYMNPYGGRMGAGFGRLELMEPALRRVCVPPAVLSGPGEGKPSEPGEVFRGSVDGPAKSHR